MLYVLNWFIGYYSFKLCYAYWHADILLQIYIMLLLESMDVLNRCLKVRCGDTAATLINKLNCHL